MANEHEKKKVTIVVNTIEHQVEKEKISFDEVVAFAFPTPLSGDQVRFTISYHKGPNDHKEGKLLEGQSVNVKDGMIFDVTATYKS